ncbi:MAG TPA: nicotinate phosphoribosyltransferase, partial [bacterium]
VDTIDTLQSGLPNAITIFEELKKNGHQPVGVRLDSGDLAYLSIETAKMLNAAGFPETTIYLSNELDELNIWQIITQIEEEAPRHSLDANQLIKRLAYGVGTRLITSAGDSALGGVYKLVALWQDNQWLPAIKISESPAKTPNPDNKRVWRIYDRRNKATADLIGLFDEEPSKLKTIHLHHPTDATIRRTLEKSKIMEIEPLLIEVLKVGELMIDFPTLQEMREIRQRDIERLDTGVKRLMNPHIYHVSLTPRLLERKQMLVESMRKAGGGE